MADTALFSIGQVVRHRLFNYVGVIYSVDPCFMLSEQWYEQVAKSKPPKDKPWYQLLVSNAFHSTYVAEQNLQAMEHFEVVNNPDIDTYFSGIKADRYQLIKTFVQ
jgi:heat shock protein HspQ